jgi:hypothetical protein
MHDRYLDFLIRYSLFTHLWYVTVHLQIYKLCHGGWQTEISDSAVSQQWVSCRLPFAYFGSFFGPEGRRTFLRIVDELVPKCMSSHLDLPLSPVPWDSFGCTWFASGPLGSGAHSASNRNEHQKQNIMFLGSRARPLRRAVNLTAICEPILYTTWNPQHLANL